jgi:uncharacterized membrane protein YgdD (TMEM256/DUF423 family)
MNTLQNRLIYTGSFSMALAVSIGAFGAHALKAHLSEADAVIFGTASFYHFIHSLGMLLLAAYTRKLSSKKVKWAGILLTAGILLFSGSLYVLATSSYLLGGRLNELGMITPLGGIAFIAGWLLLGIAAVSAKNRHQHSST